MAGGKLLWPEIEKKKAFEDKARILVSVFWKIAGAAEKVGRF